MAIASHLSRCTDGETGAHEPRRAQIGDGLILAVMQTCPLTNLASSDADFDRVPGLTRDTPV